MAVFFWVLLFVTSVFAERATTSATENDPSSFVEGVNMVTGDFCMYDDWYVVEGAEPIRLSMAYLTKTLFINQTDRLLATYWRPYTIQTLEPHGTLVFYRLARDCKGTTQIGESFYGDPKKKKKWEPISFHNI